MIVANNKLKGEIFHVSFNQDSSCFSVATKNGFYISDCNPFKERFRREFEDGSIGLVEMLYKSNIFALVGGGESVKYSANKVLIWDDHQAQCIAELSFHNHVKGVKLRKDRITVVLEKKTFIYDFSDLGLISQFETCSNPLGLCAMSSASDSLVIALLGENVGEIQINNYKKNSVRTINAHTNAISRMAMDSEGKYLATASVQGTMIRVFDIDCDVPFLIKEFRRGTKQAEIQSISFIKDGSVLCCSSSTGTIHIYYVQEQEETNKTSTFSMLQGWLPITGDIWSAKQIYVSETQCICAIMKEKNQLVIIVLGATGKYYKYIETEKREFVLSNTSTFASLNH